MCGKERERFLENPSPIFKCKITIFTFGECKKCELLRVSSYLVACVNIDLRLFTKNTDSRKVSDSFRKFQKVAGGKE